ncbi:MAG: GDSL-type esterase/lipase family protein [Treponema sp.]|jgi:lysophospholipase L1-like esterase|nr:GDSL-type esterase/lipase family protein [Treponema sp.]
MRKGRIFTGTVYWFCTFLVFAFVLAGCPSSTGGGGETGYPTSPTDPAPNTNTLVAFGDSLTYGTGAGTGDAAKENSFTKYLSQHINLNVVNAGKHGDTTADAISRLSEVSGENPRIVLIEFGGNDYFQGGSTQDVISQAKGNYITMIETLKNKNRKIFLLKFYTQEWFQRIEDQTYTDSKTVWDNMYAEIVKQYPDVGLVENIWDGITSSHITDDYVHPNADGYIIMGTNIFNSIKPYLLEQGLVKNL